MCGTMNPVTNVYCDRCQARLLPMAAPGYVEPEREQAPVGEPYPPPLPAEEQIEWRDEGVAERIGPAAPEAGDWLAQLRAGVEEEGAAEEPESTGELSEPVELPAWLRESAPPTAPTPTLPVTEAVPEEAPPAAPPSAPAEELPEWLRRLAPPTVEAEPEEVTPPSAPVEELPDWLRQSAPAAAAPRPTLPTVEAEPEEALPAVSPPAPAEELPDWLRALAPSATAATPTPPAFEAAPEEARPTVPPPAEAAPEEALPTVPPPAPAEEIPDWLRTLAPAATVPAPAPPTVEVEPEEARPTVPPPAEVAPEEALPTVPPPAPAEIPDWLRELAPSAAAAAPRPTPPAFEVAPEEAMPTVPPPAPAEEIPDWLRTLAPSAAIPVSAPPTVEAAPEEAIPTAPPLAPAELPDWLRELAPPAAVAPEAIPPTTEAKPPSAAPEIPAWLREPAPPSAPATPALEGMAEAEGLARAEIPDWLEALRPRPEAGGAAVKVEEPVETAGPLEGLSGVLVPTPAIQVSPKVRETIRPPEISQVSLSRAQLLQSLLAHPAEVPQPRAPKRGIRTGQRLQRWLVAVVLLVAVGSTLLVPGGNIPTLTRPAQSPAADGRADFQRLTRMYDLIQGTSAESTALVAFEYGPPEADELNLVAEPILRHLLDQGAHISIASTRPEGQAIAAGLLSDLAASEEQYTLLGYRPGDAAGVSQFLSAAEPRPTLILVLTAQPGPLRWWVEQTRALYGDTLPAVAGVSAALEPAAGPYLDASAKQLVGAVSGLSGAAAYETLHSPAGPATQRLNALTAGHVAIVGLMILGALFYMLGSPRGRGK